MADADGPAAAAIAAAAATLPLGSGPFRFELSLDPDGDPVCALPPRPGVRWLAAAVVADGGVIARCAWLLRTEDEDQAGSAAPTNAERDARWQREREVPQARVPTLAPFPLPAALLHGAPRWYCRRRQLAFVPPCPDTGRPLRTVRDDAVLAAAGLPPYATDVRRHASAGARCFHAGRGGDGCDELALLAGYREALQRVAANPANLANPADPTAIAVVRALPCGDCVHRVACHAPGAGGQPPLAERELRPLSFHDLEAVARQLPAGDLDWVSARLGSGLRRVGSARAAAESLPPAQGALLVVIDKIDAAIDLVEAVQALHSAGRPHLALAPGSVLACADGEGRQRLVLADLGAAVAMASDGGEPPWWDRGPWAQAHRRSYGDPGGPGEAERAVAVLAATVRCRVAADGDGNVSLRIEVGAVPMPRHFRAEDLVRVQAKSAGPAVWMRLEEVRARGLSASTVLPAGHPATAWADLELPARLSFHRRFGLAADCRALGFLLLRLLLGNDEQSLPDAAAALRKCLLRIGEEPTSVRFDPAASGQRLLQLLAAPELQPMLAPVHVLQRREDRAAYTAALAAGARPIPAAPFRQLLAIACRLLGDHPPVAYAREQVDVDPMALQQVVADLQKARSRLCAELTRSEAIDREVELAMAAGAADLRAARQQRAQNLGATVVLHRGFGMRIQKDGEAHTEDRQFSQEQVAIGRRADGNQLVLADPMVSSMHALIERTPEGYAIFDRGSTNGTEVDGIRLPVEVPQALVDGSVVYIRPFRLTLRINASGVSARVHRPLVAEDLTEQLRATAALAAGSAAAALAAELQRLAAVHGEDELLARLDALVQPDAPGAPGADDSRTAVSVSCARALQQLARTLVGGAELGTGEQVQQFAERLEHFVSTTAGWIERSLAWQAAAGKRLGLGVGVGAAAGGRPVLTAAEVRQLALGPAGDADAVPFLSDHYDGLLAILSALVAGNQRARDLMRERLDPQRLVEATARGSRLPLLVHAAAGSGLWKAYTQAFAEVTTGRDFEQELNALLQRAFSPGRG